MGGEGIALGPHLRVNRGSKVAILPVRDAQKQKLREQRARENAERLLVNRALELT